MTCSRRARLLGLARWRWPDLAVLAALLALALAYYYPLTATGRIAYDFDIWVFFYPLHQYGADALRAGRFPLWNPDIFLGSPFFANAQTALLYPPNLLFVLLPVPTAYTVSLWLHAWLAGAFTYLLARAALRLGLAAALVAALAFSLGGFVAGLAGHLNQHQASAWLPLLALLFLEAVRRRGTRDAPGDPWRWVVAAAVVLAVQVLAGHSQEVYLTLATLGMIAVLAPWVVPSSPRPHPSPLPGGEGIRRLPLSPWERGRVRAVLAALRRRIVALAWSLGLYAAIAALGLALAAVQLLPTAELQRESIRGGGLPYPEAISFSLPPPLLLQSLLPGFWRNPFGEYVGFIGTIPLCLAVLALAVAPVRWALVGGLLGGVGLFLAIGGYNPLYPLLYQVVPGLSLFRVPARWLFVYSFGAALLAGLGAEWAWRAGTAKGWWRTVSWPRLALVALAAGIAVAALVAFTGPLGARRFYIAWGGLGLVALALVALALVGRRRLALGLLTVAVAAELFAASAPAPFRAAIPPEAYRSVRPALVPLLADGDGYRVLSLARDDYGLSEIAANHFLHSDLPPPVTYNYALASKHNEVLTPNLPLEYGLATVDGYDGGVLPLRRWVELMRLLTDEDEPRIDGMLRHRVHYLPDERLLNLLGVRWVLTSELQDATVDGIPFDRLATRRLAPGERFELPVPNLPADAVALLSSVDGASLPDGATMGRLSLVDAQGRTERFDVRLGRHTARAAPPGEAGSGLATAPPPDPRLRNVDYATRLPLVEPMTVTRLVLENAASSGTWLVRGATLLAADGATRPLTLSPALERLSLDDLSPIKLYRNRAALPPVFLVPQALVADDTLALDYLRGAGFAPDRVAMLAPVPQARALGAPPAPPAAGLRPPSASAEASAGSQGPAAGEAVRVLARSPERWLLETNAPEERFLVFTQAFFPGWEAAVDGVPRALLRANYLFQGLYVPAGSHQVELTYRPRSLVGGLLISLAALLVAAAVWAVGSVRWSRAQARTARAQAVPLPPEPVEGALRRRRAGASRRWKRQAWPIAPRRPRRIPPR